MGNAALKKSTLILVAITMNVICLLDGAKIYLDNEKANASCVYICFICNNVMLDVVSQYGHIDRCQSIHA